MRIMINFYLKKKKKITNATKFFDTDYFRLYFNSTTKIYSNKIKKDDFLTLIMN